MGTPAAMCLADQGGHSQQAHSHPRNTTSATHTHNSRGNWSASSCCLLVHIHSSPVLSMLNKIWQMGRALGEKTPYKVCESWWPPRWHRPSPLQLAQEVMWKRAGERQGRRRKMDPRAEMEAPQDMHWRLGLLWGGGPKSLRKINK